MLEAPGSGVWLALRGGQERLLKVLDVGARPLVEDDDVHGEPLQAEVFVGEDELAGESDVGEIIDADEEDRQVARDPLRPERALNGRREVASGRRPGSEKSTVSASDWNSPASSGIRSMWRSWIWAWVQASVRARSKASVSL